MSQAEDLLNGLSDEEIKSYTADPSTEPHIVIDDNRNITVPEELRRIAVQYDHNIETVTFDCPRYWDGIDMSNMQAYINYMRSDGYMDKYVVKEVKVDSTDDKIMHFDWVISRNVTEVQGVISFLVCFKEIDEDGEEVRHWNSELNRTITVSEGLECEESILNSHPDIITHLLSRMDEIEGGTAVTIETSEITGGQQIIVKDVVGGKVQVFNVMDGATFTPSVSDDGVLSWTNERNKTNPEPVNIKGPKGDKGDTGAHGHSALTEVKMSDGYAAVDPNYRYRIHTTYANPKMEPSIATMPWNLSGIPTAVVGDWVYMVEPFDSTKFYIRRFNTSTLQASKITVKMPGSVGLTEEYNLSVIENDLYIFATDGKVYKFNVVTNTITDITPSETTYARLWGAVASVGKKIYLFGGRKDLTSMTFETYDSIAYFDTETKSYTKIVTKTLPNKLATGRATVIGNKVYIWDIGTWHLYIYDTNANSISTVSELLAVDNVSMESIDDKIYLFSPAYMSTDINTSSSTYSSDIYQLDSETMNLTKLSTSLPYIMTEIPTAVVNNKVYLLGGKIWADDLFTSSSSVGLFTPANTETTFSIMCSGVEYTIPVIVYDEHCDYFNFEIISLKHDVDNEQLTVVYSINNKRYTKTFDVDNFDMADCKLYIYNAQQILKYNVDYISADDEENSYPQWIDDKLEGLAMEEWVEEKLSTFTPSEGGVTEEYVDEKYNQAINNAYAYTDAAVQGLATEDELADTETYVNEMSSEPVVLDVDVTGGYYFGLCNISGKIVDWGDGTIDRVEETERVHQYSSTASSNRYCIKVYGLKEIPNDFMKVGWGRTAGVVLESGTNTILLQSAKAAGDIKVGTKIGLLKSDRTAIPSYGAVEVTAIEKTGETNSNGFENLRLTVSDNITGSADVGNVVVLVQGTVVTIPENITNIGQGGINNLVTTLIMKRIYPPTVSITSIPGYGGNCCLKIIVPHQSVEKYGSAFAMYISNGFMYKYITSYALADQLEGLATEVYVDNQIGSAVAEMEQAIGDINSILDSINGEVV